MTDYSIPNGDLKEVAEAFERITRGECVAFRTVDARGKDGMQMVCRWCAVTSARAQHTSRSLCATTRRGGHPALFGRTEHAAAIAAFKESTQEAVNNLARAEIDKQIHDAEAGIAYLKGQREKLDKAGADAYEVFLRQPWPRRAAHNE